MLNVTTLQELKSVIEQEFTQVSCCEVNEDEKSLSHTIKHRIRYWTDGLVIGSEIFIREIMSRFRGETRIKQKCLARLTDKNDNDVMLCSWRRLRT